MSVSKKGKRILLCSCTGFILGALLVYFFFWVSVSEWSEAKKMVCAFVTFVSGCVFSCVGNAFSEYME